MDKYQDDPAKDLIVTVNDKKYPITYEIEKDTDKVVISVFIDNKELIKLIGVFFDCKIDMKDEALHIQPLNSEIKGEIIKQIFASESI